MKKLPLIIAITSTLITSAGFAIDSNNETSLYDAKIFTKAFEISVNKEPEIIVDPPEREIITLNVEKLEDIVNSNENINIGSMAIETTAQSCYASVTTMNNFKLQGEMLTIDGTGNTLASYGLHYIVQNKAEDTSIIDAYFSSNSDGEKSVGCNTADLKMNIYEYNSQAPVDAYNDVITVEVRAES
jgi:hypothetical protein